jgi:hypothetical protein
MSKVNDYKMAQLAAITGKPVGTFATPDMEVDWLSRVRGRAGNTLNELWEQEFIALASGSGAKVSNAFDDNAVIYLTFLNRTGDTLPEMWQDFWNGNTPA